MVTSMQEVKVYGAATTAASYISGALNNINDAVMVDPRGGQSLVCTIGGTISGLTLAFECQQINNPTWIPVGAVRLDGTYTVESTPTVTVATSWSISTTGLVNFRVRALAISGGPTSVNIQILPSTLQTSMSVFDMGPALIKGGGSGSLTVTDGTTTVDNVTTLDLAGTVLAVSPGVAGYIPETSVGSSSSSPASLIPAASTANSGFSPLVSLSINTVNTTGGALQWDTAANFWAAGLGVPYSLFLILGNVESSADPITLSTNTGVTFIGGQYQIPPGGYRLYGIAVIDSSTVEIGDTGFAGYLANPHITIKPPSPTSAGAGYDATISGGDPNGRFESGNTVLEGNAVKVGTNSGAPLEVDSGTAYLDAAQATGFTSDGITIECVGNFRVSYLSIGGAGLTPLTGNGQSINPVQSNNSATAAAPYTGLILSPPSIPFSDGAQVSIINRSAFSLTFDVAGTSNVANGVACVMAPGTKTNFTWDAMSSLWYPG